jgi:hypothetical protein
MTKATVTVSVIASCGSYRLEQSMTITSDIFDSIMGNVSKQIQAMEKEVNGVCENKPNLRSFGG